MNADALLSRLDRVKRTGVGTFLARCPTHDDRRPSLSIRECDDGRVLLHCFAGCAVDDVVAAVGLKLEDLFPDRGIGHRRLPERRPFPAQDVLRALALEALVVVILARQVADGHELTAEDHARLVLANSRLLNGIDAAGLDEEGQRIRRVLMKSRRAANDVDVKNAA